MDDEKVLTICLTHFFVYGFAASLLIRQTNFGLFSFCVIARRDNPACVLRTRILALGDFRSEVFLFIQRRLLAD